MKKITLCIVAVLATLFTACNNPQFTVQGTIGQAEGDTLYFENANFDPIIALDSVVLDKEGKFSFRQEVPEQAQFFRLRLNNKVVNLLIDTVATITYTGYAPTFATFYNIEGSDDCVTMRNVAIAGARLKEQVNRFMQHTESTHIATMQQMVTDSIAAYKAAMTDLILQAPASPVAYFILLQQVNGLPVFDTFNPADNRIIAAAATSHDIYAPDEPRTKFLHNLALQGIAARRAEQAQANQAVINTEDVEESNFIDIVLYDLKGNKHTLSEVTAKNRIVLLDFTAYQMDYSPNYNMALGEIYRQYASKGLEIFQVSLDTDIHNWKITADNLPWICVHDDDNIYSQLVQLYNIQSLPACFVIIDNGNQLLRPANLDELKSKLAQTIR